MPIVVGSGSVIDPVLPAPAARAGTARRTRKQRVGPVEDRVSRQVEPGHRFRDCAGAKIRRGVVDDDPSGTSCNTERRHGEIAANPDNAYGGVVRFLRFGTVLSASAFAMM